MIESFGAFIRRIRGRQARFSSKKYWEMRYAANGSSGAGSYGRLAEFKAAILNGFVAEQGIERVLEMGCGDGNQLSLAQYPSYAGFDVAPSAIKLCKQKYAGTNHRFLLDTRENYRWALTDFKPQLVLSLDVIFHLVEDRVFHDYMTELFSFDADYVAVYSSNGNFLVSAPHLRNWTFTEWIEKHSGEWKMIKHIANRYPFNEADPNNTSFSDFYFFSRRA